MGPVREIRILATAFGGFPGVRLNPTLALTRSLASIPALRARNSGLRLETLVLPVVWDAASSKLLDAIERFRPDVVLSVGVAGRRRRPTVELRSIDRRSMLRPDSAKARALSRSAAGDGAVRAARVPAARMAIAMTRAGARTALSIDAGDYICNEALHAALKTRAPVVGFVHIPHPRDPFRPKRRAASRQSIRRPTSGQLASALRAALHLLVVEARRRNAAVGAASRPESTE